MRGLRESLISQREVQHTFCAFRITGCLFSGYLSNGLGTIGQRDRNGVLGELAGRRGLRDSGAGGRGKRQRGRSFSQAKPEGSLRKRSSEAVSARDMAWG